MSYLSMEVCIKCMSYAGLETESLNKSRPVSLSITSAFIIHISSDFILPKVIKGPVYFQAKIFISNLIFFIVLPTIIIWNNNNIYNYVHQKFLTKISVTRKTGSRVAPLDTSSQHA